MAKLDISVDQQAQINSIDTHLENAFAYGVQVAPATPVLDPMQDYLTLQIIDRAGVKNVFRQVVAAVAKVFNIQKPLPTPLAGTHAVTLLKSPSGTVTLTFTDGMLTAKSET